MDDAGKIKKKVKAQTLLASTPLNWGRGRMENRARIKWRKECSTRRLLQLCLAEILLILWLFFDWTIFKL